ncbi:MAG: AsmA family protein [Hyphomicrobiales bacterium]
MSPEPVRPASAFTRPDYRPQVASEPIIAPSVAAHPVTPQANAPDEPQYLHVPDAAEPEPYVSDPYVTDAPSYRPEPNIYDSPVEALAEAPTPYIEPVQAQSAAAESYTPSFEIDQGDEAAQTVPGRDESFASSQNADPGGVSAIPVSNTPLRKKRKDRKPRIPGKPLFKSPWMRQAAYIGGGIIGLFLLVVFVLPFFLPSQTIAREVSRQVEQATGWQLAIDGPISVGIFPTPRFSASDVRISADGETSAVRAETVRFGINLAAIFTGNVRLDEATLIGPEIDLIVDENGRASWLQSRAQAGTPQQDLRNSLNSDGASVAVVDDTGSMLQALERLQIDAVTIRNGSVRYQDMRDGTDHLVSEISVDTALTSLDVPLLIESAFAYQGQGFSLNARLDEPRSAVLGEQSALNLSLNGSVVEATLGGAVDFGLGPAFGGQFVSNIPSVAALAAWLGTELPAETNGLDSIRVSAQLAASPVAVDVTEFALIVGEESLQGSLRADLSQAIPALSGELVSQGVDVGTLMSAAGMVGEGQPSVNGSLIVDLQFASQGATPEQIMSSLNARGTLGLRSGSVTQTGIGLALGEARADTISNITANITINTLDTPIGLLGQAEWRDERFEMSGQFAAGQMLSNGMGPAQFGINSDRVSAGVDGTFTQTGDFDGDITVETRSLRNLLAWLNQPVGDGGGLGPFSYTGELSFSTGAVNFSNARILLDGTQGTGSGVISLAGKPTLQARLALQQLDLTPYVSGGSSSGQNSARTGSNLPGIEGAVDAGWSNAPIDLSSLNGMNANLTISANEIILDGIRTGNTNMTVSLTDGVLTADLTELQLYGGRGAGRLEVNASGDTPSMAVNFDLSSLDAYPFLRDAAQFTRLEGTADYSLALTTQGRSELALVSGLDGETRMIFSNGAIRGVNLPQMVRTLSARTLLGWQTNEQEKTDFSEFSGSFQFSNGLGRTRDIRLIGPLVRATGAGTVDLPAKRLEMRFDPKVVASLQGQGANQDFAGLGVPIVVEGAFAEPRIYPDIAGILENPDAALEQLRQFGGGLAALGDDGDALRDKVRDSIGIDVNQIVQDGSLDRDAAIGQGAALIGRLIGGNQPQDGSQPQFGDQQVGQQSNTGGIPVPRPDPRGSLVRSSGPANASPRFMTPAEARRLTGGRAVVSGDQNAPAPATTPARQQTAPSSGGSGPIDLLNPGRAPTQQVLPGSGNPQGPSRNPVEGLLRGIFGQ